MAKHQGGAGTRWMETQETGGSKEQGGAGFAGLLAQFLVPQIVHTTP